MMSNHLQRLMAGILILSLVSTMSSASPRRQETGDSMGSISGAEVELQNSVIFSVVAINSICGDGFTAGESCGLYHDARASIGVSCCSCTLGGIAAIDNTGQETGRIEFGVYALNLSENHPTSLLKPPRI